jgi:hypothetical protein
VDLKRLSVGERNSLEPSIVCDSAEEQQVHQYTNECNNKWHLVELRKVCRVNVHLEQSLIPHF